MRAQAAIEYLTTYGWAIIVLLLMVSSLSLLGVINPRDWAPDRCEIGAEFQCVDHVFISDGTSQVELKLLLKNNLRERVNIDSVTCTFEGEHIDSNTGLSISIAGNDEKEITCITNAPEMYNFEGKMRASFSLTYMKRDGLFNHDVKGTAFSQVVTT